MVSDASDNKGDTFTIEPERSMGEERLFVASQWQLMWWRFRKHKLAIVGTIVLLLYYAVALFWEFLAPYDPRRYDVVYSYAPPQIFHFVSEDGFHWPPFVYGLKGTRDPETLRLVFTLDRTQRLPVSFFVHGDPYRLWGLFETDWHLFGLESNEQVIFVLGADRLGRDLFSRLLAGSRISMTIGLTGVFVSLLLGVLIGGISGYYGGMADIGIQRIIEVIRSMPTIPLWMALAAAVPRDWSPVRVYFGITVILSLIGWTGLARVVRGRFLSLREDDFVLAARLVGSSELRIILRHMVPSFLSHIIASITLAIPGMILSETSLSFLGLGIRPPAISWGVLLQDAQNLRSVAFAPWLLLPGVAIVVVILAFNFFGDGIRDAADPYR